MTRLPAPAPTRPGGALARLDPRLVDVVVWVGAVVVDLSIHAYSPLELRFGGKAPLALVGAVVAATYAALLARRSRPRVVFAVMWWVSLAGLLLPQFMPFAGLLVALHTMGRRASATASRVALGVSLAPLTVHAYNAAFYGRQGAPTDLIGPLLLWTLFAGTAWGVGRLGRVGEERAHEQATRHAAEASAALEAERVRIARELHDIVTHSISAMTMQAAGARAISGRDGAAASHPQVSAALAAIEETGAQSLRELHRLLGLLRGREGDTGAELDLSDRPRVADIEALAKAGRDSGLVVRLHREGVPVNLDPSVDLAAYRVVQESLSNARRHAGRDGAVDVRLRWREGAFEVLARSAGAADAGQTPGSQDGFGLRGLRERVELVGGTFSAGPAEGAFLTSATFPIRVEAGVASGPGRP